MIENKKSKERGLTKRLRIVALEHYIDKLQSQVRASMGFCVKIMDNNPFETDFHTLQNDAQYLYDELDKLLEEWQDTTK
jgi:hypothetical protein